MAQSVKTRGGATSRRFAEAVLRFDETERRPVVDQEGVTVTPPLKGVKVLEIGNFLAAPFCTMQLADLGADVIKIERPGVGDIVRSTGPFIDGESSPYLLINRNKRSLSLDMSVPEGKEVFRRLAKETDIIVENL
ncbi:MAG TPA: CoA transferase, partial [Acidimicrobiales bacterium]|nr:CoA transferase [Acidimicrobiales bacterium]